MIIDKNFVYLSWRQDNLKNRIQFKNDNKASVQTLTTVGPYKNVYSTQVFQKNAIYQWDIKIQKGSYFKIGILKESQIGNPKIKAFSDSKQGFAYFSPGKFRNGQNKDAVGVTDTKRGYGPGDVVKVRFNTIQGTLEFAVNEDDFEQAYQDQNFKKGGYVAAVASLHEGSLYSLTLPLLQD